MLIPGSLAGHGHGGVQGAGQAVLGGPVVVVVIAAAAAAVQQGRHAHRARVRGGQVAAAVRHGASRVGATAQQIGRGRHRLMAHPVQLPDRLHGQLRVHGDLGERAADTTSMRPGRGGEGHMQSGLHIGCWRLLLSFLPSSHCGALSPSQCVSPSLLPPPSPLRPLLFFFLNINFQKGSAPLGERGAPSPPAPGPLTSLSFLEL